MGRVQSWEGDNERRLAEGLRELGFASATGYAASRPTASVLQLAAALGPDVAAFHLERRLFAEAADRAAVQRFARDLLVRALHEQLPEGWHRDLGPDEPGNLTTPRWRCGMAAVAWASAVATSTTYDAVAQRIMAALHETAPFPDGWLPGDADDPLLVEFFVAHWHEPA